MKLHLKIISFFLNNLVAVSILTLGCKGTSTPLGHNGPFDVPTTTPGPVTVTCYLNYNGFQSNINWNLVDSNGNTINSTSQSTGSTGLSFQPTLWGVYSVNIPAQTPYLYSSQSVTITGSGNYSVTFSCSNETLSSNPSSVSYSANVGYQIPITISYSKYRKSQSANFNYK